MDKAKMAIRISAALVLIIFMILETYMFFNGMDGFMVIGFIVAFAIEYPLAVAADELSKKDRRYRD